MSSSESSSHMASLFSESFSSHEQKNKKERGFEMTFKRSLPATPEEELPAPFPEVESNKAAYIAATITSLLISLGGFLFGWDTGTISGIVVMPDFLERFADWKTSTQSYAFSVVKTGLIVSIFTLAAAPGGLTLGKLGDKFGRKKGLFVTLVFYMVGVVVQISSNSSWIQFFFGRILTGMAVGSTLVICPIFISEVSPKAIRGTLVCLFQLSVTLGIFIGYCVCYASYHNYDDSRQWRIPIGLDFAWALIAIAGLVFAPESPRYLIQNGNLEMAQKSISRINKAPENSIIVLTEMNNLIEAIDAEKQAGKASWRDLVTGHPKIAYRLIMGIVLDSLQVLSGNTYFFYYGTSTFKSVGLTDGFMTSIILGLVNFVSTFGSLYVIDHLGRRKSLILGSAGMLVCLIVYSSLGVKSLYPEEYGVDPNSTVGDLMILFCCLYIFSFATTWGPGIYVILGESYPIRVRSQAIAIATAANWIWGFLIAFFTPMITNVIHFAYGFVFAGLEAFAIVYVYTCVPETKGIPLEDVDEMYANFKPGLAFKSNDGKI
ncbi:hypothetical protein FOA43_002567 [Brettanomyces nanus]|uniref:Major facilitator superfamily (MFS) profile domain-containing protein n=1 Tax=Eeniella nana TaxID=13502 RepID=A0A875RV42_EENNA|nr:uncharacterized protein FOA43_002567 [Brettanomyces nanus]QPG75217.1 hypothetical protein FOA43_002567 [Brettanomyces nanus]